MARMNPIYLKDTSCGLTRFVAVGLAVAVALLQAAPKESQRTFATPQEAIQATIDAAEHNDAAVLLQLFGPDGKDILESGDPVQNTVVGAGCNHSHLLRELVGGLSQRLVLAQRTSRTSSKISLILFVLLWPRWSAPTSLTVLGCLQSPSPSPSGPRRCQWPSPAGVLGSSMTFSSVETAALKAPCNRAMDCEYASRFASR